MKKILILTTGFGEGHNAAARGIRDGLAQVAPQTTVEMHDLPARVYPVLFKWMLKTYLTIVNRAPRLWGWFYDWLQKKEDFSGEFQKFARLRVELAKLLENFQPDVVVSVFPPFPYLLDQIHGANKKYRSVVVVTDSITINKSWYRSAADYFLVPNDASAKILRDGNVPSQKIKVFGFPVSPKFADLHGARPLPSAGVNPRVLYMINAGPQRAPALVDRLLDLEIDLTVTVGRNEELRRAIEAIARSRKVEIVGWTNEMPRMLAASHVLIGKAGGATVQETIAAACPMIINHVVSGQEEGNAILIERSKAGVIAPSAEQVIAAITGAFADEARQWREWQANISKLSRPRAALDIAEFLMNS